MSYKYETQYNSPNYTSAVDARAVWGRARTIESIAIHWWGDPNTNPSYEGVISVLCNPARQASAHYVATGTGRRVACLVSPADASWATNSANPYTISIECDPRCRDEDYDVVAELIASIRSAYGNLPLVPHRQFSQTQCPGNYDLGRLDAIAKSKDASGDWGDVKNIVATPPPAPAPTWVPVVSPRKMQATTDLYVINLDNNQQIGSVIKSGTQIDIASKKAQNGTTYLRSAYATSKNLNTGIDMRSLAEIAAAPPQPPVPIKTTDDVQNDRIGATEKRLNSIEALLKTITDFLSSIFTNFKK